MGPNGVTSKADWDAVNAALGRVVASVPESTVMDVYNAVSQITDPGVPVYMKSLVNGQDAEKAYEAFLKFKDVVKANQVTAAATYLAEFVGTFLLVFTVGCNVPSRASRPSTRP